MTAPLRKLWEPGAPLPRRANRMTMTHILETELGICVGPRYVDRLDVRTAKIAGQCLWPVDETLKAARSNRIRPALQPNRGARR